MIRNRRPIVILAIVYLCVSLAAISGAWSADVTIEGKVFVECGEITPVKKISLTPMGGEPVIVPVYPIPGKSSAGSYKATVPAEGMYEAVILGEGDTPLTESKILRVDKKRMVAVKGKNTLDWVIGDCEAAKVMDEKVVGWPVKKVTWLAAGVAVGGLVVGDMVDLFDDEYDDGYNDGYRDGSEEPVSPMLPD